MWDNLKTLTDPKDQSTQYAHDALGRVTVETRPLGGQTTYAYTAAGQLRKRTDARGVRTEYAYDALGRVSTVSSYAPGQTEPGRVVSLGYDRLGRLTSYTDGQTSGLLAYDALGRKTAETVNYGPFSRTNTYTWAANGQLSGFTGPDGQAQTFAYDTAGRLTAIGLGSHMATIDAYTWTAPGSMTLPGGVKRNYGHDGFLRLIAQNATDPADNPVLNHAYQYNDRGNMARKATEHGDYAYAYDILDRLITSQNPGLPDESFTYDKVGNRLSAGDTIGPWSYNANNELLGVDAATYRYDDHGNLIEKTQPGKTLTFAYDLDNRLSEVKENSAALATYGYDPFGRRIWKEVHGQRTYFHYSDQGLVAELDATGALLKSYGYKPGSPWGTDPLYVRQGGKNHWYLTDHLGTPQQVVAENGAVVWQAQYEVFGNAEVDAGSSIINNLRFPGQYYDSETGLYYNWNRYYDPETGRYTQTDPIGFDGGDVNLYGYAKNNYPNEYDNNGLLSCAKKEFIKNCIVRRPCPSIDFDYPPKNFKDIMFFGITRCGSREEFKDQCDDFREFVIPQIKVGLCLVKCTVSASFGLSLEDVTKTFSQELGDEAVRMAKKKNIKSGAVFVGSAVLKKLKFGLSVGNGVDFIKCSVDCCD